MKVIDLLNKIVNGEIDKDIKIEFRYGYNYEYCTIREFFERYIVDKENLNQEVEIIEEEKKIPEKRINNSGDLIILGQENNWTQKFNKLKKETETTDIELNPYVFEAINENFKDIENKIYEIIDYLKSKGDE